MGNFFCIRLLQHTREISFGRNLFRVSLIPHPCGIAWGEELISFYEGVCRTCAGKHTFSAWKGRKTLSCAALWGQLQEGTVGQWLQGYVCDRCCTCCAPLHLECSGGQGYLVIGGGTHLTSWYSLPHTPTICNIFLCWIAIGSAIVCVKSV